MLLNILGFVFFGLSLKGEKKPAGIKHSTIYDKDYDLSMNDPTEEAIDDAYQHIEEEYEERYKHIFQPVSTQEEEEEEPYVFPYETTVPKEPVRDIESFKEKVYTPVSEEPLYEEPNYEPINKPQDEKEDEYSPYQYQPTYETYEPEEANETPKKDASAFNYEPTYMTEEELEGKIDEPIDGFEFPLERTKEVDYQDEVQPTEENEWAKQSTFDGDYQFKHAYSKDERYKYEYDEYKGLNVQPFDETEEEKEAEKEEEFDYTIDIDSEHAKYYGSDDNLKPSRYELYLQKEEKEVAEKEDDMLSSVKQDPSNRNSRERQLFQPVDIEHAPETPLDRKEREAEETIDIKQFEPKKYENEIASAPIGQKAPDEFDDEEVDRRIEYLMGKMHDPFQGKKKKSPLDEEF